MASFPRSVWLLVIAYALMHSGGSLMVFIAAIIGAQIAPSSSQATLPIALMIVGVASSTLPLGKLQARFGRKVVFLSFALVAIGCALLAYLSIVLQSFVLFCLSAFGLGFSMSSAHQYRFAVTEHVSTEKIPLVTSILLFGGLLSAFIGPEIALLGQSLLLVEFAGSFLLLAAIFAVCFGLILAITHVDHENISIVDDLPHHNGFKLILQSPLLLLTVISGVVGFFMMSFIMTATPLTMHEHAGHSLPDTKWVIQSHIAAMYLPSLFSGLLIKRFGFNFTLWLGVLLFSICIGISLTDQKLINFWVALVLLGVAWNFFFMTNTTLLSFGHNHEQRFAVQSSNDFVIFSFQALAALSSGWFLYRWQWQGVLGVSFTILAIFSIYLLSNKKLDLSIKP